MRLHFFLSVLSLLLFSLPVIAQSIGKKEKEKKPQFWERLTVRKAFETKTGDDTKPAIFSYTAPKDTTDSYLFNGGLGFDLFYLDSTNRAANAIAGFFVYNRNTLVDKKQKNYKVGITGGTVFDLKSKNLFAIFATHTLQYLHNYVDTSNSIIVTSYWHPLHKRPNFINLGGYEATPSIAEYYFLPQIGLEYQNVINANSKAKKGYDARLYFNMSLKIKLKKKTYFLEDQIKEDVMDSLMNLTDSVWRKKPAKEVKDSIDKWIPEDSKRVMPKNNWAKLLELSFSYTGRSAFIHHNSNFESYIPLFTAGINVFPLNNDNFSFGLSYNNGANPIDATPKQSFWLFSITFKK